MFAERSFLQHFRDERLRKKGVALAKDEIARFHQRHTPVDIRDERERQFKIYDGHYRNSPFYGGWVSIWLGHGADDAQHGSCRYDQYDNEWYDSGWWQRVEKLLQAGWVNSRLESQLEDVIGHFKKLKSKGQEE